MTISYLLASSSIPYWYKSGITDGFSGTLAGPSFLTFTALNF